MRTYADLDGSHKSLDVALSIASMWNGFSKSMGLETPDLSGGVPIRGNLGSVGTAPHTVLEWGVMPRIIKKKIWRQLRSQDFFQGRWVPTFMEAPR